MSYTVRAALQTGEGEGVDVADLPRARKEARRLYAEHMDGLHADNMKELFLEAELGRWQGRDRFAVTVPTADGRTGVTVTIDPPGPQAGDLMDTTEVAELLGISPEALRAGRSQSDRSPRYQSMPAPLRLVSDRPVWSRPAIEAWAATLPRR